MTMKAPQHPSKRFRGAASMPPPTAQLSQIVLSDSEMRQYFSSSTSPPFSEAGVRILRRPARRVSPLAHKLARNAAGCSRIELARLVVLLKVLFRYLEKVDPATLQLAMVVLKDCERKYVKHDSQYPSLEEAIGHRLRDTVGEAHWARARQIRGRVMANRRNKKTTRFGLVGLGQQCTL